MKNALIALMFLLCGAVYSQDQNDYSKDLSDASKIFQKVDPEEGILNPEEKKLIQQIHVNNKKGYQILKIDDQFDLTFCISTIENANWCGFRYLEKRNIIKFESGLQIELYSISEMNNTGINNSNGCELSDEKAMANSVWKLSETGVVLRACKSVLIPKQKLPNQ